MTDDEDLFTCQQCGQCCHGETTVSLDAGDVRRQLRHLGLSLEEAKEKFWRIRGEMVQMQTRDGRCIFFDRGCTIHSAKPWRCRQWPLHPSILLDEANFLAIRSSCPGINRDLGYDDFRARLAALLAGAPEIF